jgi:uncharacterized cupin superfamily protein
MTVISALMRDNLGKFEPMTQAGGEPAEVLSQIPFSTDVAGRVQAGIWKCSEMVMVTPLSGDEALYIIEGRLIVEIDGQPTADLGPGDSVLIAQNTTCTWTIAEAVTAFYAIVS